MKYWQAGSVSLLIATLAFAGCAKKSTEQASITGTGFDSSSTPAADELAQLPQQTSVTSQQTGVEVLPVETSPVTQGVSPVAGSISRTAADMSGADAGSLTREQEIQTALKNAGFYKGPIDGKIGRGSKRAIEAFQKQNHLKSDGKVGPKTWAALESYLSGSQSATDTAPTPDDAGNNADQ